MAGLADTLAKRKAKPAGLKTKSDKKPVNGKQADVAVGMAAMLAKRKKGKLGGKGLAGLKAKKDAERATSSPQDFTHKGLRYHNAKLIEIVNDRPIGTVCVSNNDVTVKFHNKYVAWFHDVVGGNGIMKEPVNTEISRCLIERWERELKALGVPTQALARKKREEEEAANRKREAAKAKKKTKKPPTLKTKKGK